MSTSDDQASDAPEAPGPSPEERRRTRWVVVLTSALTLAIMGLVIAAGVREKERRNARASTLAPDAALAPVAGDGERDPGAAVDGCPYDPEHPPRLVFDLPPTGFEFGAVKQGVVLEHEITFRNEGSGPLCVRRVDSGCGCIKAHLVGERRRFEPGQSGQVKVTLDTKGRDGIQKKTITVYTNVVDDPLRRFTVHASITLGMRVGPSYLNFGRATAGRPAKATVRLRTPKDDADWKVTEVVGTKPFDGKIVPYTWEVVDLADPRDLVREIVITHPGIDEEPGRAFQDTIRIRTTHPDRPEIDLAAHLLIVQPILAVPPRAHLGFVPSPLPPQRIRLVPGDDSVSFQVTGLEFESRDGGEAPPGGFGFVATKGQDPATGEWYVEVGYDGKPRAQGRLQAVLVVHTDLDRMPTVRIDCFANVEK